MALANASGYGVGRVAALPERSGRPPRRVTQELLRCSSQPAPHPDLWSRRDRLPTASRACADSRRSARYYLAVLLVILLALAAVYLRLRAPRTWGVERRTGCWKWWGRCWARWWAPASSLRFYSLGQRFQLLVGLAFFVSGAADLFHGILEEAEYLGWFDLSDAARQWAMLTTFTVGRLAMALLLALSPVLPRYMGRLRNTRRETVWVCLGTLALAALAMLVAYRLPLPDLLFPQAFISRPLDFACAVVFGVALVVFLREYHRTLEGLTWWLALSIGINLVGQLFLSCSRAFYDPYFCAAHAYKALGYGVPLLGFSLYQTSTTLELRHIRQMLNQEMERLGVTLRSIGDAVIATDNAGLVVLLNGVAETLTGWRQAEAVGQPLGDVFQIFDGADRANPAKILSPRSCVPAAWSPWPSRPACGRVTGGA